MVASSSTTPVHASLKEQAGVTTTPESSRRENLIQAKYRGYINPTMSPKDVRKAIMEACVAADFHPVKEMIDVAKDKNCPLALKASIAMELTAYMAPKLKSIEIGGKVEGNLQVTVRQFGGKKFDEPMGEATIVRQIGEAVEEITADIVKDEGSDVGDHPTI